MHYYIDESGSTGDLISKRLALDFANQPIFSHACIGFDESEKIDFKEFIIKLKENHEIDEDGELKSQEIYYENPKFIYDISKYLKDNITPFFCEVLDKKYNIAISIVNHHIIPATQNEQTTQIQKIRLILADSLSKNAKNEVFQNFMQLCLIPSENNLIECFNAIKLFFKDTQNDLIDNKIILSMIDKTIDNYYSAKKKLGSTQAISYFMPIPDFDNNNNIIGITPHVQCFYNIVARLNKYHLKELSDITLHHDEQKEFSSSLNFCFEKLKEMSLDDIPYIPQADFDLIETPILLFEDSKSSIEIQTSDLLSGFMNRFINGYFYKKISMKEIYIETFNNIIHYNRFPLSPLGTNFVLPPSIQKKLFHDFNL
ncbi:MULTISPECIES: DUF3800 domain-containing protein [unclassified Providencia]|uniref:DUF3800 domain-containing protein n=1 Tax=unclassified Providencia TaxID=2633465 RepID=UPI0023497388|nr:MULTISPECIES: DUF3800 domain-containing protein [unclassified Providencia]